MDSSFMDVQNKYTHKHTHRDMVIHNNIILLPAYIHVHSTCLDKEE